MTFDSRAGVLRSARTALVAVACLLRAAPAIASEPVEIVYLAPASCPSKDAFLAAVRARLAASPLEEVRDPPRTFIVTIEAAARGYAGRLEVTSRGQAATERRWATADCADLASGLALLTALAIAPDEATPDRAAPAPAELPAERAELPATIAAPDPLRDVTGSGPSRLVQPAADTPSRPQASSWSSPWRAGAGLATTIESSLAPVALFAPELYGELTRDLRGAWSPALRLGVLYAETGLLNPSPATARYRWGAARVEACPVKFAWSALDARACAAADVGAIWAEGVTVAVPTAATRPWLAAGAAARLRWSFAGPVFAELEGGGLFPITRPAFTFRVPDEVVYQVPAAMLMAGAGVGVSFL